MTAKERLEQLEIEARIADMERWNRITDFVGTPATATQIISYLDQHPAMKAKMGGLYLQAKQTLAFQAERNQPASFTFGRVLGRIVVALLMLPRAFFRPAPARLAGGRG